MSKRKRLYASVRGCGIETGGYKHTALSHTLSLSHTGEFLLVTTEGSHVASSFKQRITGRLVEVS